jgi:hypothetical protein
MSPLTQQHADKHIRARRPRYAAAQVETTRQERVIFTAYVVMGALIAAFMTATSVAWALGA